MKKPTEAQLKERVIKAAMWDERMETKYLISPSSLNYEWEKLRAARYSLRCACRALAAHRARRKRG